MHYNMLRREGGRVVNNTLQRGDGAPACYMQGGERAQSFAARPGVCRLIGEQNFEEEVRNIISFFEKQRQTLLFSATMPNKIQAASRPSPHEDSNK